MKSCSVSGVVVFGLVGCLSIELKLILLEAKPFELKYCVKASSILFNWPGVTPFSVRRLALKLGV